MAYFSVNFSMELMHNHYFFFLLFKLLVSFIFKISLLLPNSKFKKILFLFMNKFLFNKKNINKYIYYYLYFIFKLNYNKNN